MDTIRTLAPRQEKIQVLRQRFLNDMVYYYGTNPHRRTNKKKYKNENGIKCAIGRYIDDKHKPEQLEGSVKNMWRKVSNTEVSEDAYNVLPFEIYQLGKNFLTEVQRLYDNDDYWDNSGLNYFGQTFYNSLILHYCSEILDYESNF